MIGIAAAIAIGQVHLHQKEWWPVDDSNVSPPVLETGKLPELLPASHTLHALS